MCEQNDTEMRKILQQHLSNACVKLQKLDENNPFSGNRCQTEPLKPNEIDSGQRPEPRIVLEPIEEITLDAALSSASDTVAQDIESIKEDSSIELVELPIAVAHSDASPPHASDDEATQDEPKKNDDSDDSFRRYEMWEKKQKAKRKKLTVEKIRMVKARYGNCRNSTELD